MQILQYFQVTTQFGTLLTLRAAVVDMLMAFLALRQ